MIWRQGAWHRTGWCSFRSSIGSPLSYTCQLREFHYDRYINQTPKRLLETLYPSVLSRYRVLQEFLRPTLFWSKAPNLNGHEDPILPNDHIQHNDHIVFITNWGEIQNENGPKLKGWRGFMVWILLTAVNGRGKGAGHRKLLCLCKSWPFSAKNYAWKLNTLTNNVLLYHQVPGCFVQVRHYCSFG